MRTLEDIANDFNSLISKTNEFKDKILTLNKLGVEIVITDINDFHERYNQLFLKPSLTNEEAEEKIDQRILFIKNRVWINIVEKEQKINKNEN
jgi:hypothetical protein